MEEKLNKRMVDARWKRFRILGIGIWQFYGRIRVENKEYRIQSSHLAKLHSHSHKEKLDSKLANHMLIN